MTEHLDKASGFVAPTPALPPALQTRLDACTEQDRDALQTTWHLAGLGKAQEAIPEMEAAWARLEGALDNGQGHPAPRRTRPGRPRHRRSRERLRWGVVGLVVMIVVGVGLAQWRQPVSLRARAGATVTATLPDGSRAELNSGSVLTYERRLFGWTRSLRLDGEAFFEVVPSEAPFVVETFNAAVSVLGTRFNVRAWSTDEQPETAVVLASGSVELASRAVPDQAVLLAPGQMSRLLLDETTPRAPETVSVSRMLAWRSGGLAFNHQPLGVIFSEIERRFDIEIVARPQSIAQDSLVLFLADPPNAEAVLDALCSFRGYHYRKTADGYEITEPGQP